MIEKYIDKCYFTNDRTNTRAPVELRFAYDESDPFAVILDVITPVQGTVRWQFDRELLRRGRATESGIGDVTVRPGVYNITIRLSSPDGAGVLSVPTIPVRQFLDMTYDAVLQGEETYDMDLLVTQLLDESTEEL